MIFAKIDALSTKRVVAFETGTRALFDQRRAGTTLWVFLDYNNVVNRSDFPGFLKNPTNYHIDKNGNLRLNA